MADELLDLEVGTDRPLAVPSELPILPLRDTVLFPNSFMPLAVAREASVRLIDESMTGSRLIAVFTQRDASVEEPSEDDLFRIGTATHIHKMFKLPDGSLRLIVQGLSRLRLDSVTASRPYLRAQVQTADDAIREEDRLTACISTQVGCPIGCVFCASGRDGLARSLEDFEMVEQMLHLRSILQGSRQRITHLVVMGMGEPMLNLKNLTRALLVVNDPKCFNIGQRHVTVSTVGLVPAIERLGREDLKVNLAISLHAASDEVRGKLMPVNRAFDVEALMAAVKRYPLTSRQRVFFEYVLLDGVNDSPEEAQRLARLLRGVKGKVNLIPFNDWDGAEFARPPLERVLAFQAIMLEHGVTATVRWSKGEDIGAACGQLREAVVA